MDTREDLIAVPAMLSLARESRGMTQVDLADEMSRLDGVNRVSQGYVSRAEAGRLQVKDDRLELYAKALGYTPEMLCRTTDIHGVGVGLVHHRKRAFMGATSLRRIHATLTLTRLQVESLTEPLDDLGDHDFRHIEIDDLDTPEDAAATLREEWGMSPGPVDDLISVIENAGASVVVRDLGTAELDAVSQWSDGIPPLFLLNSTAPGDRFRFSLAHELGHVVMHTEPGDGRLQEQQADRFAAEFLMPHDMILPELKSGVDLPRLMELKSRWGVSMAALIRRALSLGVVTEWQYRNLMVEMSALGYRTIEPVTVQRESPRHIAHVVTRLEQQHHLGLTDAAHLAGLGREEFHEIYLCASSSSGAVATPAHL
ncbi:ImmA/IrrE family metallo-endopeptidase [Actinacidiphila bryophytorum]|uniref:ImmA/IrrE family metallo-endopeptidase n=1 Tax=Actinacidiphila bryophytorum TaxID=1436133 RepID=UPI002176C134|nr:ImmA/IrrE family metallo-endopeptidase [Actinacidiphila bryophytorum]UWE11939.1 ImmA/IrrE family metallo-endopeptidase [Actinacidiphila bryophytorum]